ncbi:MAG: hypothetical protein M3O70_05925, partial [Actinomycetota bacterium]|nr:hypothetical protein [Actinomycetota bacterium]
HYANNDPLGFIDPLGLRPLTDADLRAFREAAGRNLFERGGDWAQDNWEYLAAGAAVVGGVALMAIGVGGPAGRALLSAAGGGALIGGGASVGVQRFTTGGVDWARVGIDAAIGGAAGPIGAGAAAATSLASPLVRGAVAGATESLAAGAATRAAYGEDPFNPPAMLKDLFLGGTPGALGGRVAAAPRPISSRQHSPDFIVHPNGEIVPVPKGAIGPTSVLTGKGFQFRGGSGGHGLDPRVTDIRIMDPVTMGKYQYPHGYVSYLNPQGQTVNPRTGRTIPPGDPWWHWAWSEPAP